MCTPRLFVLAEVNAPRALVRLECPEHGVAADTYSISDTILLLAASGHHHMNLYGRLRHGG